MMERPDPTPLFAPDGLDRDLALRGAERVSKFLGECHGGLPLMDSPSRPHGNPSVTLPQSARSCFKKSKRGPPTEVPCMTKRWA